MWGGVDKKIYGLNASSLGLPDFSNLTVVPLEENNAYGDYIAPYDCLVIAYSTNTANALGQVQHVAIGVRGNVQWIVDITRRAEYNSSACIFALKGTVIQYNIQGTGNFLYVYKLIPN